MSDNQDHDFFDQYMDQALTRMKIGDNNGAIDNLRQALSIQPDNAIAHAWLAINLMNTKRIYAAEHESQLALNLAPESPYVHSIRSQILLGHNDNIEALKHSIEAVRLAPDNSGYITELGKCNQYNGNEKDAKILAEKALEMDPENTNAHILAGELALNEKSYDKAMHHIKESLRLEPENSSSQILAAQYHLKMKDYQEAKRSVLFALNRDPENTKALSVLCAIKAASNPFSGLWWKFNSYLSGKKENIQIMILLAIVAFMQIFQVIDQEYGLGPIGGVVTALMIAFCLYTWFGAGIFRRSLRKEMKSIKLNPNF